MESVRSMVSISELAQVLRSSKAQVHKALTGRIAGVPRLAHLSLGRRKLVPKQWFDQWLEANRTKTRGQRNGGTEVGHGTRAPVAVAAPHEFLFPLSAMQSIQKLVEDQERVCVAASASHIFVAAGSRLLVASKLAGTFPDYGRILVEPATSPVFMVMQRRSPAPWRRAPFTAMPDKTVGTDINGCAVTEFTVTPFGTNVVAAEWKEGACAGGNMLLQEVGQ